VSAANDAYNDEARVAGRVHAEACEAARIAFYDSIAPQRAVYEAAARAAGEAHPAAIAQARDGRAAAARPAFEWDDTTHRLVPARSGDTVTP